MTACLFGTFEREHSANRLLRLALQGAGVRVVECHVPLWERTRGKDRRYFGPVSLAGLGARWVAAARRLARRWRAIAEPAPLVVVGFGGQLDVLLARRVCRPRAGLVFAPLVTLSETLVEDRARFRAGGLAARALAVLDGATLRAADLVLADTAAHAEYLAALGAPPARIGVWHLGAEPEFLPARPPRAVARRVLFYGSYVPLHGTDTIVRTAARLGDAAEVVMLGAGPERARAEALARTEGARVVWRDPVPLAALPATLAEAAVVLGVFGAGRKAAMVVPNKVYQAAAVGRPLVTRDGPALREVLQPGEECIACAPEDPAAIAGAIRGLLDDPERAERLGRAARAHLLAQFSPERQAARLAALLADRFGVAPAVATSRAADGAS